MNLIDEKELERQIKKLYNLLKKDLKIKDLEIFTN